MNLIIDIFQYVFHKPEEAITMKMNPQKAAEIARFVDVFVNTNMSLKEILSQYKTKEVLSQYKPEEVLSQYKPEEVFSQYKPEEVFSHYKTEDILSGMDTLKLKQLKEHLNSIELC